MKEPDYCCPICRNKLEYYSRYPNYVCKACANQTTDEHGRALSFYNVDATGGFTAVYTDNGEQREGHICFIQGRKCRADEARMGGIVVELDEA